MPIHPDEHRWLIRLANLGRSRIPPAPPIDGPPRPPRRLEVFGCGPDWVQLTWSALGPGPVTIRAGDSRIDLRADGGPGAAVLDGLAPAAGITLEITGEGIPGEPLARRARTLGLPPGDELLRVATVSDVHVGSTSTGYFHTIVEIPAPDVPHPVRCFGAALAEATAWGAEHLVVKGDLVHRSQQQHWRDAGAVLAGVDLPVQLVPGNHERSKAGDIDPSAGAAGIGLALVDEVQHVDHSGVRLLMADTTRHGTDLGNLTHVGEELVTRAAGADGPVLLTLHHQPMRFRFPTYLPPGLPGNQVRPLLRRIGEVNHRVLVTSGHTHRHRRHRIHGVTATEVGSTKDFPGTWAGYHVHEGGVVQVVRRITEPSCIRWTDHTRRAALGVWGWWAPGSLDDRCFTLAW